MKEQLEQRLEKLRSEFADGQAMIMDLDQRQAYLRSSLLRISGAIQVLEELLKPEQMDQPIESFGFSEAQPVAASA